MSRNISSILGGLLALSNAEHEKRSWQPPVDIYRVPDGWLLKFELAGVASQDVTVAVDGSRVVVRGIRLDRCREAGCSLHRMEISYNWFERTVELPDDLDRIVLRSEFVNGMLLLRLTKGLAS